MSENTDTTEAGIMRTIDKGKRVEVRTTNGGEIVGTLYESYVTSYGVTLCEIDRPIDGGRVESVRELPAS